MPKFLIYFVVEQLLNGEIEVEAVSREAARDAFYRGDYDEARLATKLDLDESEDDVVAIYEIESEVKGFS
jgi:hypothetical protein